MRITANVLGLDVGSVAASYVEINPAGNVVTHGYVAHHGRIQEALPSLIPDQVTRRCRVVAATSSTPAAIRRSLTVDSEITGIATVRRLHPEARALLTVGGEKFSLVRFDEDGRYLDTRSNSSCAAGTGSFLDQQAAALGLRDGGELATLALTARGTAPKIASRCAVFAKTDLIHAQQEGYGKAEIASGLCRGLASIVADTLFAGDPVPGPIVFAGGVARNRAVCEELEKNIGQSLLVDEDAHLYGAFGAASRLLEQEGEVLPLTLSGTADLVNETPAERKVYGEPLELRLSSYPEFESEERYEFHPEVVTEAPPVEVDVYRRTRPGEGVSAHLGIDIGSTSTKAVLREPDGSVLLGLYTRTAGRPLAAAQALLEAVSDWQRDAEVALTVLGAGTTGSGRKLIGAIVGADLVVDEITAHARAAHELDARTDTIIEIGGQDAKFTTMKDGMVTSAVMNTVCAAGTGSFIEEQASRLDCPLEEYADAVAGARAPLASDRCTVFMQRDVNHLLGRGHTVPEVLAAALHSVRENYLTKVAREGDIGDHICFQGATAKNRALVAAFEQRLGKPILVSRYCHLTGALGVASLLAETLSTPTSFRGVGLFEDRIRLENEVCELCRNHCKIVKAEVRGDVVAYGYLCGRDHDGERRVARNASGFDLLKTRRAILTPDREPVPDVTIGLPAALSMYDELGLWRHFFEKLGVRTITSERCPDPVSRGKRLARAEFCAPMTAWHGHIEYLAERADYVLAPVQLEARRRDRSVRRQYCYYSQYAAALTDTFLSESARAKVLMPVVTQGVGDFTTRVHLYKALKPVLGDSVTFTRVAWAWSDAVEFMEERQLRLRVAMAEQETDGDIAVVLLGRPYACLAPSMNKGIPDILGALGVKTFFMDMLDVREEDTERIRGLLEQVHWHYAAKILEAACAVADRPGLYPVLVTSFKCAPDSFTLEFFRRILDEAGKPYLVLELDEHDSSVGYETRIEAAVRAFRNHRDRPAATGESRGLSLVPRIHKEVGDRSLFLPNWDRLSCSLVAANLRREGIDAHILTETDLTIRRSLRENTGQCIPLNAIVEGFTTEVAARGLPPEKTALWIMDSRISCNIGMYPSLVKAMLEARGFESAAVYCGDLSCADISIRTAINTYFAYMFGGMLRRLACRVRPYEVNQGETDAVLNEGLETFRRVFLEGGDRREAARLVVDRFLSVRTRGERRPKVALFGDLYTRDNEVMNQGLVRFIERHGGEVVTTPYSEYVKIVADTYFQRWFWEGKLLVLALKKSLLMTAKILEKQYTEEFQRVLGPAPVLSGPAATPQEVLSRYGLTDQHSGESMDNVLKVHHLLEQDPDIALFVQANPAFCCPSLVTEAMSGRIREATGVPVVTVTYDGTAASHNDAIIPYLKFGTAGPKPPEAAAAS